MWVLLQPIIPLVAAELYADVISGIGDASRKRRKMRRKGSSPREIISRVQRSRSKQ
jgi:hypothetical protein